MEIVDCGSPQANEEIYFQSAVSQENVQIEELQELLSSSTNISSKDASEKDLQATGGSTVGDANTR